MKKITFDKETHTYRDEQGNVLISVTQLLSKHGLAPSFKGVDKEVLNKAANRGTMIHEEFEKIVKTNGKYTPISEEAQWFLDNLYKKSPVWISEYMVWTECKPTNYAGTIDLIGSDENGAVAIYDIKTGQIHRDAVAWQLSLYRYAYCKMLGFDTSEIKLYCIDAKESGCKIIPIIAIPDHIIETLLEYDAEDVPFTHTTLVTSVMLRQLEVFEGTISELQRLLKEKKEHYETFKAELMERMLENGAKSIETIKYKITRVDPTTSVSFDSDAFKKDNPKLYEQYNTKVSNKKGYLKITEKKKEDK